MALAFPVPYSALASDLKQHIDSKSLLTLEGFQICLGFPDLESLDVCWPA